MKLLLLALVSLLLLPACGSQRHQGVIYRKTQEQINLNNYKLVMLPYRQSFVYCIQWQTGGNSTSIGGLSCDFDRYYQSFEP